MVYHAEGSAYALRDGGGKLAAEYLPKVVALFFDRPELKVHSHSASGKQRQVHFARAHSDAYSFDGSAAAQIQGTRQTKQENRLLHVRTITRIHHFHGAVL